MVNVAVEVARAARTGIRQQNGPQRRNAAHEQGWAGVCHLPSPTDRAIDRLPFRSLISANAKRAVQTNQADAAANFGDAAGAAANTAPSPSVRSRARALRASVVGRAAPVIISSSRLESMLSYCHDQPRAKALAVPLASRRGSKSARQQKIDGFGLGVTRQAR